MKKYPFINILISILAITVFSCQSHSQEKWKKDMQLKIYKGGGKRPESKTVIIDDTKSRFIHWAKSKTDTFYFKLSQDELNSLLQKVNEWKFKSIISGETGVMAYDKETKSIELKEAGKIHEVNVGAVTGIKKGNTEDFYNLFDFILSLAEKKTGHEE